MKLRVKLDKPYVIEIGENLTKGIVKELKGKRCVIITDSNVRKLFGAKLLHALKMARIKCRIVSFQAGEKSKNLNTYTGILSKIVRLGLDRSSVIIALGGGIVGDIAGFVASTYMRGIDYVQIPTTLLAMVDSSIGGKTGVDLPQGKNLIGTFHQPKKVFVDISFLETLPDEEYENGLVEMLKHGFIKSKTLVFLIENSIADIKKKNKEVMKKLIYESLKIKASIVEQDEKESNIRMLLNYGHSFGHAFEALSNYRLSHGKAVAAGMIVAARLSNKIGKLSKAETKHHNELIKKIADVGIPKYKPKKIIKMMKMDKKNRNNKMNLVLLNRIGEASMQDDVSMEAVIEVLEYD
ncbi:3-dehydroquinate synthase [Candidatus Woesearchaeota archaeon]|nr:3-dehydroquinate synthase [Candidatus Woesearchaeota archaeon]